MVFNESKSFRGVRFGVDSNGNINAIKGFWCSSLIPGLCKNSYIITIRINKLEMKIFKTFIHDEDRLYITLDVKNFQSDLEVDAYINSLAVENINLLPEEIKNTLEKTI